MSKPPKTLVIGGAGFLGRRLLAALRAAHPGANGTDRDGREGLFRLDLAKPVLAPLAEAAKGCEWAIIAATAGNPARCEREPEWTRARNVDGTLALAKGLSELGMKVVVITTDYVFDGKTGEYTDDAKPHPLLEYGRQKADVEKGVGAATGGRALLVRPGKVFGLRTGDGGLLDEMVGLLRAGREVRAATDQRFCPIFVDDLVRAILALQAADARGIVNVPGPEALTRYELARRVAQAMGMPAERVRPISLDDLNEPFKRPKNTTMRKDRLDGLIRLPLTPLAESIARAIG